MRGFDNIERRMSKVDVYWLTRYIGFMQGEYRWFRLYDHAGNVKLYQRRRRRIGDRMVTTIGEWA